MELAPSQPLSTSAAQRERRPTLHRRLGNDSDDDAITSTPRPARLFTSTSSRPPQPLSVNPPSSSPLPERIFQLQGGSTIRPSSSPHAHREGSSPDATPLDRPTKNVTKGKGRAIDNEIASMFDDEAPPPVQEDHIGEGLEDQDKGFGGENESEGDGLGDGDEDDDDDDDMRLRRLGLPYEEYEEEEVGFEGDEQLTTIELLEEVSTLLCFFLYVSN